MRSTRRYEYYWLAAVLLIATILRMVVIMRMPILPDEWMVLQEGLAFKWSALPVHFVGFGSGENITLGVLARLMVDLGFQPLATLRSIVLIANLISIVLLYRLSLRFFDRWIALLTIFFAAIWPWNIIAGSIGFNVFLLLPIILSVILLFIYFIESRKNIALYAAYLLLALSFYTYASSFVWAPVLVLVFFALYTKRFFSWHHVAACGLLLTLAAPVIYFYATTQLHLPAVSSWWFLVFPHLSITRFDIMHIAGGSGIGLVAKYLKNYLLHYNFIFLVYNHLDRTIHFNFLPAFMGSGLPFLWNQDFYALSPGSGLFYSSLANPWDPFFIVAGLYRLLRYPEFLKFRKLFLMLFIAYPLGPSIVNGDYFGYTPTRDIIGLPFLIMLSTLGCAAIIQLISDTITSKKTTSRTT